MPIASCRTRNKIEIVVMNNDTLNPISHRCDLVVKMSLTGTSQ